ncbi:hypothetical protein CC1G_04312 [Coprinopsis cinerea okayama7|uniref:peptidyl-tRNA hydrolase n=1 Tax=Coprinopsis cinerea (strain Okayama-7 / 130 / ATCC MYA-4618 / FGSC 9003) TaxID=240176 RepID=A8NFN7_COPC7|nr:hypothetical protein CC1G_04312 [Coprinopsis cinerea okayama7\|eukprot:XP_001833333.2 hypothetical protein CC1G_04312 [Coprinopsis cinerea okayama7\
MSYSTGIVDGGKSLHIFVAGLGNAPMPNTRHSIGQYIVSSLGTHFGIALRSTRGGHIGSGVVDLPSASGPVKITLFKSKQLMNASGPSIVQAYRAVLSQTGGAPKGSSNFVVLGDSISHTALKLSARLGGSAQGHNGLKSISNALGRAKDFWQFRVGVGRGVDEDGASIIDKNIDAAEWVMGRLSEAEKEYWGVGGKGLDSVMAELGRVARQLES